MRYVMSRASLLTFVALLPGWAGEGKGAQPSTSLAGDLKELTRGARGGRGSPVRLKSELTGKVERVTPALAFLPIDKDPKPDEEQPVIIGVDDAGNTVGCLATFRLAQEGPKRSILLNVGDKQVRLWYSLRGGKLRIAGDTKISVK